MILTFPSYMHVYSKMSINQNVNIFTLEHCICSEINYMYYLKSRVIISVKNCRELVELGTELA